MQFLVSQRLSLSDASGTVNVARVFSVNVETPECPVIRAGFDWQGACYRYEFNHNPPHCFVTIKKQ